MCETVWFFSWVNTHSFDMKFVAFCPIFSGDSYVGFQGKLFRENFSEIFVQTKAIIYQNLKNFAILSAIFILCPYGAEKSYTNTFIGCLHLGKEARPKTYHKKKIRWRKARTFCFWKTSFVHSRSRTYYALLLGCFSLKFLPDVRHCVYWVLNIIWTPDSSHKIDNKYFIDHCQGWKEGLFVCETVWFFSWVNTHLFNLTFVTFCPKFNGDSHMEFQEKTISGDFFWNFRANQGILYQNFWNFDLLFAIFILRLYCAEKSHASTFICCLLPSKEARP